MANTTNIEWTDATWNPITGCSIISPGCTNCYVMKLAGTRLRNHPSREGLTKEVNGNHVWAGEVRLNKAWLEQPLHWRNPRMIFVCAHGDLFHKSVPDEWIDCIFAIMALCPQHTFQVLTKRAERMRVYLTRFAPPAIKQCWIENTPECLDAVLAFSEIWYGEWPLPNVWLGVSV